MGRARAWAEGTQGAREALLTQVTSSCEFTFLFNEGVELTTPLLASLVFVVSYCPTIFKD